MSPRPRRFHFCGQATIVFLTVCTLNRTRWLADRRIERDLIASWKTATAWIVGRYVIMPDHLHLVCSPIEEAVEIETWVTFWKRQFRRIHGMPRGVSSQLGFITGCGNRKVTTSAGIMCDENQVRAGLAKSTDDWPFAGELNELRW